MGLADVVAKAAQFAIASVGDIRSQATFTRVVVTGYDAKTDTETTTTTTVEVMGVLTKEKIKEDNKSVDANSLIFLVSSIDLGIVPQMDDELVIDGATYQIVDNILVPGRAIWKLRVRLT